MVIHRIQGPYAYAYLLVPPGGIGELFESSNMEGSAGPLKGVRVIELAGIGPSPFCCMMLADAGAEVIRVEPPGGRDGRGRGGAA